MKNIKKLILFILFITFLSYFSIFSSKSIYATTQIIGEAGTQTGMSGANWYSPSITSSYYDSTPLVFATTQTEAGGQDPSCAHIRNVTTSGFDTQHCEFDSYSCDSHNAETNGWLALDPAKTQGTKGMDGGTTTISGNNTVTVNFNKTFTNTPIVFAQAITRNDTEPVNAKVTARTTTSADIKLCQQNSADGCNASHGSETIAWLAIDPQVADKLTSWAWGTVTCGDASWQSVSYSLASTPVVIVETQTLNGSDEDMIPEALNVTSTGASVRFCETNGGDACTSHVNETCAWLAVLPGNVDGTIGDSAPSAPTTLKTEGLVNPTDLVTDTPSFTAVYNDGPNDDIANAYRIQVDDNSDFSSPLWDTTASGGSDNITLQPGPTEGIDCQVDACSPDTSIPDSSLRIGKRSTCGGSYPGGPYRSLLKFDLSSIPSGATINSASLEVYIYDYEGSNNFQFYQATSTWDETATWNTLPSYNSGNLLFSLSSSNYRTHTKKTADVTTSVQNWVDGTWTNHGWYIKGSSESDWSRDWFSSSDDGTETYRPKLVVDYDAEGMANCDQGTLCSSIEYNGSNLTRGTTYYWRIKYWDDAGQEGAWSTEDANFKLASGCPTSSGTIEYDCIWENNMGTIEVDTVSKNIVGAHQISDRLNTAQITVPEGKTITVQSDQVVLVGSLDLTGNGSVVIVDGGQIKPGGVLSYEDKDGDGYAANFNNLIKTHDSGDFTPVSNILTTDFTDCDDNNDSKWENLTGYTDNDEDTYTVGGSQQICSGNSLPSGYTDTASAEDDCNDNNVSIWASLSGYTDNDNDGYGTGAAQDLCTNGNLPSGYADNNNDIDDNNDCADNSTTHQCGDGDLDGTCTPVSAGENGLAACQRCNGSSIDPVNVSDNTQDTEGSNLCNQECKKCSGGSCVNQSNGEDLFSQCGIYCDGSGACSTCLPLANSCSTGTDCCSGNCVDGFCCDTACNGTCQRCDNYDGSAGTCHLISQGNDPDNECSGASWGCTSNCQRRRYEGCDGDSAACEDDTYTYDNIAQGYVCENGNQVDPYYLWDYCDTDPSYCASWSDCVIRTDAYSCDGSGSCTYQEITIGSDVSDGTICENGSEVVAACDETYSCFYNRHLCQKACGDVNAYEDCNWPVNCTTCTEYCASGACQSDDACDGVTSVSYRGKTYSTVEVGNQCWLSENINVGNLLMLNEDMGTDCSSPNTDIQKWCVDENEAGCDTYGGLYTWSQATCAGYWGVEEGAKGICPEGWHIPTPAEYYTLSTFYTDPTTECEYRPSYGNQDCNGPSYMGSYDLWESYTGSSYDWIDARNHPDFGNSGWNGIPGGYKYSTLSVSSVGYYGEFWMSKGNSSNAWAFILGYGYPFTKRDDGRSSDYGYSVRCIKNDNDSKCQTCTCSGDGYETITCNGETVYVDCAADICWAPAVDYSDERTRTYTAKERILEKSYGQNNDWMMPDKDTLQAMCQNQCAGGTCFGDSNSNYSGEIWAEPEGGNYWYVNFSDCSIIDETDTFANKAYGFMRVQSVDTDGDGYYSEATGGGDCNDNNASVNPGQAEVCGNGLDDNCDLNDCLTFEEYPCSEIGTIPNCDTMCGTGQDLTLGTCYDAGLSRSDIGCRWDCDTDTCSSVWGDHCGYSGSSYYGMKCGRTLEEGTDCYTCTGTPYSYEGYEEIITEQDGDWHDPGTDWVGCCTGAVCCCSMH